MHFIQSRFFYEWVKVAQSYPTLCDLMDHIVHGILQARTLACIAYPFSGDSSWPGNQPRVSCTAGRFSTNWATREARVLLWISHFLKKFFPGVSCSNLDCFIPRLHGFYIDISPQYHIKCSANLSQFGSPFSWILFFHISVFLPYVAESIPRSFQAYWESHLLTRKNEQIFVFMCLVVMHNHLTPYRTVSGKTFFLSLLRYSSIVFWVSVLLKNLSSHEAFYLPQKSHGVFFFFFLNSAF